MSQLLHSYGEALFGMILRILRNKEEAEDVMQNVSLKIWNNAASFDESKSTLFTWMASIARNAAIDALRSKGVKASKVTDSLSVSDFGLTETTKPQGIDLNQLKAKLPEKYSILIEKMYLEGFTQQEIADHYEMPLGTVKTRLREAINLLRQELDGEKHLLYILTLLQ